MTAPKPEANSLSKPVFGGAIRTWGGALGLSASSSAVRTKPTLFSLSASTAIFFFLRSATDLIFLLPGLSTNTTS